MPRRGPLDLIEDRFGKRKLEDDFTGIVGDFQNGVENTALFAVRLENFTDRRSSGVPGVIRVAQHFSLGIEDQFVADAGIKKISGHGGDLSR